MPRIAAPAGFPPDPRNVTMDLVSFIIHHMLSNQVSWRLRSAMNSNHPSLSISSRQMGKAMCSLVMVLAVSGTPGSQAGKDSTTRDSLESKARPADVGSLEAILGSLYDSISGPAGPRDWNRLRGLFLPGARLIPAVHRDDGTTVARVLTVDEFIKASEPGLKQQGFFESEIHRRIERFGSVAHVFSTYESRHARTDAQPFSRGINSIQLFFDGHRWWVVTIFWDRERPDQPISASQLPGPDRKAGP
jgi:hypothetical protein